MALTTGDEIEIRRRELFLLEKVKTCEDCITKLQFEVLDLKTKLSLQSTSETPAAVAPVPAPEAEPLGTVGVDGVIPPSDDKAPL